MKNISEDRFVFDVVFCFLSDIFVGFIFFVDGFTDQGFDLL